MPHPTAPIGHNNGPAMDTGLSFRTHCWKAARERLLPTLPIEVVRLRVKRAQELGLDYKTYASVRAATGHDVVAFLFSSNALRVSLMRPALPDDRAAKLAALAKVGRVALATAPLTPGMLMAGTALLDAAHPAPAWLASFADQARSIRAAIPGIPGDCVLLIGDHGLERDWCAAGRLAGYLPADRYFATQAQPT
ncbi:MAG: hypothetical protein ACRCS3_07125 [Paracoccaceae bacterium]